MTLMVAVGAPFFAFSQVPLTHEDSLVLKEATDSLDRVDSVLRGRVRVMTFDGAIDAVLKDLPFNLKNITGELVLAQGEFENYASIVELPGRSSVSSPAGILRMIRRRAGRRRC